MQEIRTVKIDNIDIMKIKLPYKPPFDPAWAPGIKKEDRKYTIVKLTTNTGITGWGASANIYEAGFIVDMVKPYIEGEELFKTEEHIQRIRRAGGTWSVSIAIWDAIGKHIGLPLYKIWGGYRERIKAYASTVQTASPEKRAEDALQFCEKGFKAIKLRAHYPEMKKDIFLVEKVKEAIGDKMEIMVDANQSFQPFDDFSPCPNPKWDFRRAKETALAYQNLGVVWLEDPLSNHDYEQLRRLREEVDILIAGGETNIGLHELGHLVEWDVYDVIQPDATNCEGLFQLHKIASSCELANKWFIPHHGMGGIGLAAHLQLSCAIPNSPYVEYIYDPPFRSPEEYIGMCGIIKNPIMIDQDGYISVPKLPGIGVEIDENILKKYQI